MWQLPNWVKTDLSITNYEIIDETETSVLLFINDEYTRWLPKNLPSAKPRNKYALHEVYRKGEVDKIDNIANAIVMIPVLTRAIHLSIGNSKRMKTEELQRLNDAEIVEVVKRYERENKRLIDELEREDETFESVVKKRFSVDDNGVVKLRDSMKYIFSEDFQNLDEVKEIIANDSFIKVNENGKIKKFEAKQYVQREINMTNKYYATQRVLLDEDYNDYVYSSYFGCSPACISYQGVVASKDYWMRVIFPNGMALHPNCKHILSPQIDSLTQGDMLGDQIRNEPDKNDAKYQREQLKRKNERRIRAQKYRIRELKRLGIDVSKEKLKLKTLRQLPHDKERL